MFRNRNDMPPCPGAAIGMRMVITIEGLGTFKSTLIGMEHGQYLIIKLPMIPDIPVKYLRQNDFVVRYVHAGGVYGFRTSLVSLIKEPMRLFVLDYPNKIESLNLRKNERYECLIPAVAKILQANATPFEWQGFIADISPFGCRFEYMIPDGVKSANVTIGDIVDFSIHFPNEDAIWTLHVEVRSQNIDQKKLILGLKYKPNPDIESHRAAINEIEAYIEKLKDKPGIE
jgi:hypothetical protein